MTSQYSLLLKFDPHGLRDGAKAWKALARTVDSVASRHRSQVNGKLRLSWQGTDATAAFAYMERTEQQLDIIRIEAEAAVLTLNTVADRMQQAQTNLLNAVRRAQDSGLAVSEDGVVGLPPLRPGESNDPDAEAARQNLARQISGYQERINAALKDARSANGQGHAALLRLDAGILGEARGNGGMAETRLDVAAVMNDLNLVDPSIPDGKDPKKSAEWWKGLTPEQQQTYLALRPAEIGRMDGLPSDVRDRANRTVLDQKLDELQSKTPKEMGLDQGEYDRRRAALETIKGKLDAADGADESRRMFLLGITPEAYGSDGRAIVATGNPDKADHTAVFVPGTGTDLNGVPGQMDRIKQLQGVSEAYADGKKVAVVSWLGYDAPESIPAASNPRRGPDGADSLRLFSQGLRAAQSDNICSHVTFIGHSYGSYMVGVADKGGGGLRADDIVTLGSPGMGVSSASELNVDPNHLWIAVSESDPIRLAGGTTLGQGPQGVGFGGNNIATGTDGHNGYWADGSDSLLNQAKIIAGKNPTTVPKEGIWGSIPFPAP